MRDVGKKAEVRWLMRRLGGMRLRGEAAGRGDEVRQRGEVAGERWLGEVVGRSGGERWRGEIVR